MTLADQSWARGGTQAGATAVVPAGSGWPARAFGRPPTRGLRAAGQNVGPSERLVSVASGSILALLGVGRRDLLGLLIGAVGGGLIYRGVTGTCPVYKALGVDTAHTPARPRDYADHGAHVTEAFLIDKPAQELYDYWRNFENLPNFMTHLESVRVIDATRSHWVAKAPSIAGGTVEWDAVILAEDPGRRIVWQSLPGAGVDNRGSVSFSPALGARGTIMKVELDYLPPAGKVGQWVAKLFGEEPGQQIHADLHRFKSLLETGEIPTTRGQPRGTCAGTGRTDPGETR